MYIHINSKYDLFSLCNVALICVSRADHLILARQLMCSSLGKAISAALLP